MRYQFDHIFLNVLEKHVSLNIHLISLKLCEKQLQEDPTLKKFIAKKKKKKNWKKATKHIRSRNAFPVDFIKKGNGFSIILTYVSDNKLFWKTIKPFFLNKENHKSKLNLLKKTKYLKT